jgi:hypothetical protein
MKGKFVWMVCLVLVAVSCKKDNTPPGILTKSQMADWMINIYLAEARTGAWPVPRDSIYKLFIPYEDTLKKRSHIADSTLLKSYSYYLEQSVALEAIYDIVIDSLNLREQRLRKADPSLN